MSQTKRIDVGQHTELSKKEKFVADATHIKELKKEFLGIGEVKGYKFTQISQTSRALIYEVSFGEGKHYEVFKKRINSRFGCVSYPSRKGFGIWAWTYNELEEAIEKFNQLNILEL